MEKLDKLTLHTVQKTEDKVVLTVLKETAEWLKKQGSSQWSDLLDGKDKHQILESINKKQVFFLKKEREIIGMVALWKEPSSWDKQLWKQQPSVEAYYIHRLIIRPNYRGLRLGTQLLALIKEKIKEEVHEIRLDCLESKSVLVNFYQSNGFEYVGSSADTDGVTFALFRYRIIK